MAEREFDKNNLVVVSDVRFLHEVEELKKNNAFIIKIQRYANTYDDKADEHISEKEVDAIEPDATIVNDGTIDDLYIQIDNIIRRLQSLPQ
jgi:hypothetical protein